jgi:hypothetical protein
VPVRAFKPNAFPGSRPMHLERRASALSSEARPQETNYRGFFHLGTDPILVVCLFFAVFLLTCVCHFCPFLCHCVGRQTAALL